MAEVSKPDREKARRGHTAAIGLPEGQFLEKMVYSSGVKQCKRQQVFFFFCHEWDIFGPLSEKLEKGDNAVGKHLSDKTS